MTIAGLSIQAPTEQHPENGYETPPWLVDRIRDDVFGGTIDLDPCTTQANPTGAYRFIAPPEDGILSPWIGRCCIYVNPPYGRTISKWVGKAIDAGTDGSEVVMLVPARTCSAWFHRLLGAADEMILIRGRLRFARGDNAPFPSALFALGCTLDGIRDLGYRVVLDGAR